MPTVNQPSMNRPSINRWWIAVAGFCMQMALGSGYAWSVFRIPLVKEFGWSISEVSFTFSITWLFLGLSGVVGGLWLNRSGPRVVGMVAGLLWGGGVFLASFSAYKLWWLYLTYGVMGGIGLGMGFVVPVAVLVKWFPDRRGLITGIAVGGFGGGALVAAPVAGRLMQSFGTLPTFMYLGIGFAVVAISSGYFMQNPPEGWRPAGWTPSAAQISQRCDRDYTLREALRTWQWWAICALLSINTIAGISVVSQAAPIFQELGKVSAVTAATFVGIISLGNGLGRVFWAWISDVTSRKAAFFAMYLIQAIIFWSFHSISSPAILLLASFIILCCYGGAYGITPAFAADYFGPRHVGPIFGLMLLPWAFPAAFGPLLFAYLRQSTGGYNQALYLIAGILTVAMILPVLVSPPHKSAVAAEGLAESGASMQAVPGVDGEA
jgi:MFS transporter, OFA family, oxalate/formate antiporter